MKHAGHRRQKEKNFMKSLLSYASDHDKESANAIKSMLENVDAVLYLLTVSSVRSFWCGKEIGFAQCLGKPIVPIAGPGIAADFIKSQSVPWIAGLKWVNWWESSRDAKIVESLNHRREIVSILNCDDVDQRLGFRPPGEAVVVGVVNNRPFQLIDLSIAWEIQLAVKEGHRMTFSPDAKQEFLRLEGSGWIRNGIPLSSCQSAAGKLDREVMIEGISKKSFLPEYFKALVLVRYCIGGQHYVSQLFTLPFLDVCSPQLRQAIVAAAQISNPVNTV